MDKRWLGIIIILIAGLGCMYLIVSNSTSVGDAVTVISDVSITLPDGYITSESNSKDTVLFNKQTNETIRIKCLDGVNSSEKEYKSQLKSLQNNGDIIIGSDFSNETLSMIEYENTTSKDKKDISLVFFNKCNHGFIMKMEHFTDNTSKKSAINFIIENIEFDFKQLSS